MNLWRSKLKKQQLIWVILICILVFAMTAACVQPDESNHVMEPVFKPFAIHVFTEDNSIIPDTMDPAKEDNWNLLTDIDLSQSDLILSEEDLISYAWEDRIIIFDSDAQYEFEQNVNQTGYFVVTLGGEPIMVGNIRPSYSSLLPRMPLITYSPMKSSSKSAPLKLLVHSDFPKRTQLYNMFYPDASERIKQRMMEIGKLTEVGNS